MLDHLHIVAPPGNRVSLRRALAAFRRKFGGRFEILEPQPAASRAIALRTSRYGLLNPVRAGLVTDPWEWGFSTLRDIGGAIADPWVTREELATAYRVHPQNLLTAITHTADARPLVPSPRSIAVASHEGILGAVASALRCEPAAVPRLRDGRKLIIQASFAIGHVNGPQLASQLGVHRSCVHRNRQPPHPGLDAVLLNLGDPRLR